MKEHDVVTLRAGISMTIVHLYQDGVAAEVKYVPGWSKQAIPLTITIPTEFLRPLSEEEEEVLWFEQKGVDPVTGKMWLTKRMELIAEELKKTL